MAELKFEAPLAQFESEEWVDFSDFQSSQDARNSNKDIKPVTTTESNANAVPVEHSNTETITDNFTETFSGSLEDLVNTFDDKITKCFCNYDESVEKLAPVQVRTQEEIMNECQ